jgi:acyl-CoA reductase-like NAD-dependent aldehyde dehydrogenase
MTGAALVAASGSTREVLAPADGSPLGEVPFALVQDVDPAVARARTALETWGRASPFDRWHILRAASDAIRNEIDSLAKLHARESGKVLGQAVAEVGGAADLLAANAELARFASGEIAPTGALPGGERDLAWVERVPLGVVVCVIPFNFPVELTVEKAGAALAAGNSVLIKPPPQNPLTTLEVCRLMIQAGLPPGALQVVPGDADVSEALCAAPGVDAVSLTGSLRAGMAVAERTARQLRKLHLELGANDASIVLRDADLSLATREVVAGRTLMNGQCCAGTKRLVVERSVAAELTERLSAAIQEVSVGDPLDPSSELGPLIDAPSAAKAARQVQAAIDDGAMFAHRWMEPDRAWFRPVVLRDVPATARVAHDDEIFAPVVAVIPVDSEDEAIAVVNQSPFGLTAAVFSHDIGHALAVAERLEVGGIVINGTNNYRPPVVPFGGVKLSGAGREGIGYTYDEMTRLRFISIRGIRQRGPDRRPTQS